MNYQNKNTINQMLFVIVLYKEQLSESSSFKTITASLEKNLPQDEKGLLYVYDNSPISQIQETHDSWDIIWVKDPKNSGLSIAYNNAAEIAKKYHKKWLFLMDQDSSFPVNTLAEYSKAINENLNIDLFSLIVKIKDERIMSPYKKRMKWGRFIEEALVGVYDIHNFGIINTGLCVSIDKFDEVGGYNEKVKIDGADFQFLERLTKVVSQFYVVDIIAYQRFSLFETDKDKLAVRYKIFLTDVRNFEKFSSLDVFYYWILILKRTTRLTYDTKSLRFFKIWACNK